MGSCNTWCSPSLWLSADFLCLFIFSDLPMQSLKIGSLNINGGRDRRKRASISEIAPQKRIDELVFAGDMY